MANFSHENSIKFLFTVLLKIKFISNLVTQSLYDLKCKLQNTQKLQICKTFEINPKISIFFIFSSVLEATALNCTEIYL